MPQDPLEGFFEGLRISQARRAEQTRSALEWQRQQQDQESKQAEIKLHQDTLNQHKKEFDAAQKVIAAKAALEHMQGMQEITSNIMKGVNVPGSTQQPVAQAPAAQGGGEFSPINPEQASSVTHTLPGGESITVPTLNEQARRSASAYEIANKPKEEALRREKAAEEEARAKQAAESKQADFMRSLMQKQYDDERTAASKAADDARADKHNKVLVDIAKIQANSRNGASVLPENFDFPQFMDSVLNGDTSREDIPKLLGKQSGNVQLLLAKNGVKALSKDQQGMVGEFKQLVDSVNLMDQVIANQPQTHNVVSSHIGGLLASGQQNLTTPEQELAGRLSTIARNLMKEKGALSNKDIERATNLMPSRYKPLETNIKKRNDYVKELDSVVDAKLSDLPPQQRAIIKKKLGLFDIKQLGTSGQQQQPAQAQKQPTAAPGATHIWTPQGIQPIQQQQQ